MCQALATCARADRPTRLDATNGGQSHVVLAPSQPLCHDDLDDVEGDTQSKADEHWCAYATGHRLHHVLSYREQRAFAEPVDLTI